MRLDEFDVLVSEIWSDDYTIENWNNWSANRGDSMANTARYVHLKNILGLEVEPEIDLDRFKTAGGYLRHPSKLMPDDWKETDSSGDQCLPWFIASDPYGQHEMFLRIADRGYRTGNGDLVSPIFYAVLKGNRWLLNLCLLAQIALFSFPYRWSDSKKWFELSKDSSADFLNWFHCLPFASKWVRKLVNKNHVKQKIHAYYASEPRCQWLLDLYDKAVDEVLG